MKNIIALLLFIFTSSSAIASEISPCETLIDKIEDIAALKEALRCQNRLILEAISTLKRQSAATDQTRNQTSMPPSDPAEPMVKKSKSNICHEKGTRYYVQTQTFTPFNSIQACLNSGGRLPRG